jgi:two-component system response regulator AlgR
MSLNILIVDDDQLERRRMRQMLARCPGDLCGRVEEASDAALAAGMIRHRRFDLLLLDIRMPGRQDGLQFASALRDLPQKPAVVFVTGHSEHALKAFDADAIDYITKPVRVERLERALVKADGIRRQEMQHADNHQDSLQIMIRGAAQKLEISEVLYIRAEKKRLSVITPSGIFSLDGTLDDLQSRFALKLIRIHRHTLVVILAVTDLKRIADDNHHNASWTLGLRNSRERLPVARRMVSEVRERMLFRCD